MNKIHATLIAGLFIAGGAIAQNKNPPGAAVPPNTPGIAGGKTEMKGEMKKDARTQGLVQGPAGDAPMTPEGGAIGNNKAAMTAEKRVEKRDEKRPNAVTPKAGGTPK